jgi:hypothetical protein
VLTGKTSSSYKISKISTADLGKYQVVVATSGESVTYSYLVDTRYESTCSRDYAEIGDTIQNGVRIINAPSDVTFSYQWYETNGVTSDLKKVTNTTATYTTTAPKVKVSAGEYTKSVQYNCVVTPSVENAYISVGELNTDVSVFPTVTYVTSLPKFASDKRFEVKGYQLKGASEIKVTVSKGSYVTVVDAAGFAHYLDSDNRTVVLQGNKAIFIADNEYDGYQVTSIVSTTSTVTVTNKAVAYTGKAITSNTAKVTGSEGKVTYTYYTDAACTKALKKAPVNPGTYYVKATVAADSNYKAASSVAKITIRAAAQNIKVATKSQTVKAGKSFQISATAKGKLSYKKTSGNKKIKVSSTGKVKVKKGLKKGTYKIKVKISAKKTANYKAASVTKTIKVVVK